MDLGIQGKTALVCSSSKGLGLATAQRLAKEGASLVLCARNADDLRTAVSSIEALGAKCLGVQSDLNISEDRVKLIDMSQNAFGSIDILVLNTGGPPTGRFESLGVHQWQAAYQLLVEPVVHLTQLALPGMVEQQWGRLLAFTSFSAKQPADLLTLSNSLRGAVIGLMRTLANEYAKQGITANSILPGYISTERMQQVVGAQSLSQGLDVSQGMEKIAASIPAGRIGSVEEFADVAAFLVSDLASYINGSAISVDGGLVGTVF